MPLTELISFSLFNTSIFEIIYYVSMPLTELISFSLTATIFQIRTGGCFNALDRAYFIFTVSL